MNRRGAVVGIGRTEFTRASGRTPLAMAVEAARAALDDAGMSADELDGAVTFALGDSAHTFEVMHGLGLAEHAWSIDLHAGGLAAVAVVQEALSAVETGMCEAALVYRSFNGRSGTRFGTWEGRLEIPGEEQFMAPHGYYTWAQRVAMAVQRHQHDHGSTCEDLGQIALIQRRHAQANPHAIARGDLDLEGYLSGRWVAEPLRVFDCCQEVDGAVAVIVTTEERARHLRHRPILSLGSTQSQGGGGSVDQWPDLTTMYSVHAAPRLWAKTGVGPADIDVACMYDCFTATVMMTFEDFGFCGKGEVGKFFAEGRATYGGDVVVNPHGGLLSEGYLHGLNHTFEAVLQLRGDAGDRQVAGAELALVTAGAGPFGGAIVYGRG